MADQSVPGSGIPIRRRWARPLRVHLSVIFVALLVAISVSILTLTYVQGERSSRSAAKQQMDVLSRQTLDFYENIFRDGSAVITIASVLPSLSAEPPDGLDAKKRVLLKALQSSPHLDGIYLGYRSGAFIQLLNVSRNVRWREAVSAPEHTIYALRTVLPDASGRRMSAWRFLDGGGALLEDRPTGETTYDPRRRPWYAGARGKSEPVSLGPYVSASTNSLTFTLAMSMETDQSIVVGTDVLLESIGEMLAQQAVSEHSTGYLFDDDNELVVHSDPVIMDDIVERLSAAPRTGSPAIDTDPLLPAITGLLQDGSPGNDGLVEFKVGGEPYIARLSRLGTGSAALDRGTVVIAAPLSDFTAASVHLLYQTIGIAIGLLIAGLALSLVLARMVSRALIELSADARRFGDLNFEGHSRPDSWITEVNMLAVALSSARDAIRTFALYVPRELVRKIVASGQAQAGQAVRQEVTILFTDIKDFTTISERLTPEDVVDLLGVYFQRINRIVERHGGVIVQYLGDSVYAMWNAPIEHPGHAAAGCACALEMKVMIDDLNAESRAANRPEFVTRFGLHTGMAVVGSVGAVERRQYTAMGDTVNVASRLEGMNKEFGTTILVSAAVRDRCADAFQFRELGTAHAKGRVQGVNVFELVAAR